MRLILYALFALSGAAGLFYEMVWSRYLALFLGHSAYAQVLVIAIFLGGMALGALLAAARSARSSDPLLWYAGAELLVGVVGLFFHEIYVAVTAVAYEAIFPALAGNLALTAFKWTLAALLILPQSVALGATFPLMAAGVLRRKSDEPGRVLALLYFTNSLGAALGVLVAGFYFVSASGLPGTLIAAAIINLVVALGAALVARRFSVGERPAGAVVPLAAAPPGAAPALPLDRYVRVLLAVSFGTAVASFAYEIGWLRMLALVLGSATHSFEIMLSAFILGLALGAFWIRRRADRWAKPLRALGLVQLVMGLAALSTLGLYSASFYWTAELLRMFARSDAGYTGFSFARYAICLTIMFPASFCAGMTLPLITRTLLVSGAGEPAIGRVYGVNTLGSIVGVALAGLLLMPWVGLKLLIVGGAALDMSLGVLVLASDAPRGIAARRWAVAAAAVALAAVLAGGLSRGFDRRLLTSGVYREGRIQRPEEVEELFYRDGRTATVDVARDVASGATVIRTNGKPDASLPAYWFEPCDERTPLRALSGDNSTQVLAPLITLAHRSGARTAAVIGLGSGISSHFLLGSPGITRLVTVEIEPEMVRGSRHFYPANRRVFDDPRSRIVIEDARTYFAAAPERFDLIFSEPSNPWVSGVASLFSLEFYRHLRRYLADDGVFGQWLHLYEFNDGLALSVLTAIHQSFGSYEVFLTDAGDMLVVASPAATLRAPDWSILRLPEVAADLCHVVPMKPEMMEAARLTHRAALSPLLDESEFANSDFYPVLDLGAERARFLRARASGLLSLGVRLFDFTAPLFGRRVPASAGGPAPVAGIARMQALALGAALRSGDPAAADSALLPPAFSEARQRLALWRAFLESGRAPFDWPAWLRQFRAVERDLHAGTAGWVDEAFYRQTRAYMERFDAPETVRDVVTFRHGLAAWNFEEAAVALERLRAAEAHTRGFIDVEELFEGGITALLLRGDADGAGRLMESLGGRRGMRGDLPARLLESYLSRAVQSATPGAQSGPAAE